MHRRIYMLPSFSISHFLFLIPPTSLLYPQIADYTTEDKIRTSNNVEDKKPVYKEYLQQNRFFEFDPLSTDKQKITYIEYVNPDLR